MSAAEALAAVEDLAVRVTVAEQLLAQVALHVTHDKADGSALVHLPAGLRADIRRHARP